MTLICAKFDADLSIFLKLQAVEQSGPGFLAYPVERQLEVICALSNGNISNDLDGPEPGFQGHGIFEVEHLKNGALWTKLL